MILLLTIVLLVIAIGLAARSALLLFAGMQTNGLVEVYDVSNDEGVAETPIIKFTTYNGSEIRFRSLFGSAIRAYNPGDNVSVLYLKKRPNWAEINGFNELWLIPVVFGGVALCLYFVS